MIRLLLVEDDEVLGFIIKEGMELIGEYEVQWANNPKEALGLLSSFQPQVIVSDVEMPGMTGLEFARKAREWDSEVPIILETCVTSSKIILEAYKIGIDNYIKKPFLPEELHAYIQGLVKRIGLKETKAEEEATIHLGNLKLNTKNLTLTTPEETYTLTPREFKLLELLYKNQDQIVSKETIAEELWGDIKYFTPQRMDTFIYSVRKYLHADPRVQIRTTRGLGYTLFINTTTNNS